MLTIATIAVQKPEIDAALSALIRNLFAQSETPGGFLIAAPLDDPKTQQLVEALSEFGLQPWPRMAAQRRRTEYVMSLDRRYSIRELKTFELLELAPHRSAFADGFRRIGSDPTITIYDNPSGDVVAVHRPTWIAVSDRVKGQLSQEGLRNMIFLPTKRGRNPFREDGDPVQRPARGRPQIWWELRSSIVLPRTAETLSLVRSDGSPCAGEGERSCYRREGLYSHPELRYRRRDIAALGDFDLAHTREAFGEYPTEFDRPLVASHRFFDACLKNGIETDWVPVRLED